MTTNTFVPLSEVAQKNKCDQAALLHEAAIGNLKLSLPFYGIVPTRTLKADNSEEAESAPHVNCSKFAADSGVFDLHTEDVVALLTHDQIAIEAIFSPCGCWVVSYKQPRVITLSDIVVRAEAASAYEEAMEDAKPITDSERSRLLRQIGAMALLLAASSKKYTRGTKPNAKQISEAVLVMFDELPHANSFGLGNTNLRESISEGIELLTALQK